MVTTCSPSAPIVSYVDVKEKRNGSKDVSVFSITFESALIILVNVLILSLSLTHTHTHTLIHVVHVSQCRAHTHSDTKASDKLTEIITNNTLCNAITHLSPQHQTSPLKSFHSVINHFAPKSTAFSYLGMKCR